MAGLAFGIAAAVAGLFRLRDAAPSLSWGWLALLACLIALGGREAGCLLLSRALPRLALFSPRARIAALLGTLATAAFLLAVIPVPSLTPRAEHEVTVVATGRKSVSSYGSEVWVHGLFDAQQARIVAPAEFIQDGSWELRKGTLVSHGQQPAVLRWHGLAPDGLQLRLTSHSWSGIAEITLDGVQQTLDLYADPGSAKDVCLPAKALPLSLWQVAALRVGETICLGSVLLALTMWLVTRAAAPPAARVGRWAWLVYALPPAIVWSYYLWVFWPGLMTWDSFDQWSQMTTGRYDAAHPVLHTWTNWLLTRLWLSPAAVAIGQIVALGAVAGWGLALMRRRGMPRWLAVATCLGFALMPCNGALVITLWKDVFYSTAMLALILLLLLIVTSEGKWLESRFGWLMLAVAALLVALYRHNGPPVAFATLLVLPIAYRRYWKPLLLSLAVASGVFYGVKGPLSRAAGVVPPRNSMMFAWVLHHVAAHLAQGTPLLPPEREVLDRIVPLKDGPWPYNPYSLQPFFKHPVFGHKDPSQYVLAVPARDLLRVFFALFCRRPGVDFEHWTLINAFVWRIRSSPAEARRVPGR